MLDVDWKRRISLSDLRCAIEDVESFSADGAIFESSMARWPWEADMDIESESDGSSMKKPLTTRYPKRGPNSGFSGARTHAPI
jgi:hypothetical protein